MSFGFDVDRLLVWISVRDPDSDPMRSGSLCRRHADAMVVPRGWTLDDRRDAMPRLFPSRPDEPVQEEPSPPTVESPSLEPVRTVADVAGSTLDDTDPDATVAIPWLPSFDEADDLGGVLAATSPLLARAFRGTDRRR